MSAHTAAGYVKADLHLTISGQTVVAEAEVTR